MLGTDERGLKFNGGCEGDLMALTWEYLKRRTHDWDDVAEEKWRG